MRFFVFLKLPRFAWALRRYYCPVSKDALVLEVGSGGNPYMRSDILLDAYEETQERHWVPLTSDRPTFIGKAEKMPFQNNAFDFVIASHVLEHSTDPDLFLNELQRVSKAGYIEVPIAIFERLNPYKDHRLEIYLDNNLLVIRKKKGWQHDPELVELYERSIKSKFTSDFIPKNPFEFHVRYYWNNEINYKIVNNDFKITWVPPESTKINVNYSLKSKFKKSLEIFLSLIYKRKTKDYDLKGLLHCIHCGSDDFNADNSTIICNECGKGLEIQNNIIREKK